MCFEEDLACSSNLVKLQYILISIILGFTRSMVSSDPEMEDLISPLPNDRFLDSQDVERRNDGDWKSYNLLSLGKA